jgi:hypothetical protein
MFHRVSLRVLIILILVAALSLAPNHKAYALCSGTGCNGLDPISTGCSNTTTTAAQASGSGASGSLTIYLRYSTACVSNWAYVASNSGNRYVRAEVNVYQWQYRAAGNTTSTYSNMVDGTPWHCAVGHIDTTNETYYNTHAGPACG